jgi:signal transduction histidine kinase
VRTEKARIGVRGGGAALIVTLTALVVLLPISLASLAWSTPHPALPVVIGLALGFAALHGASLLSVRRPVAGFLVASALMLLLVLIPAARAASAVMHPSAVVYLLCLAQVAARERVRVSVVALGVGLAGAGMIALAEPAFGSAPGIDLALLRLGAFLGLAASATAAWACGLLVRSATGRAEERTAVRVRQAIADERMRISGELHDVVAHAMTVMIAQSEVARALVRERPEVSERALGVVVDTGRDALRGMRAIVAAEGEAPKEPLPTADSLAELVASVRSPACATRLVETGARRALAPASALALQRAAREGLTNAMRHALPPVRIEVRLSWSEERVALEIEDDGGSGRSGSDLGTGTGLVSLGERIRLAGGSLASGAVAAANPGPFAGSGSHGWLLRAELPVLPVSPEEAGAVTGEAAPGARSAEPGEGA